MGKTGSGGRAEAQLQLIHTRPLRSFGRRTSRRVRGYKRDLIQEALPKISIAIPQESETIHPARWFKDSKEIWLEIGFGAGEHLVVQAERHPEVGFIGCEPFVNGMANLLAEIENKSLKNIRVFGDDARLLLSQFESGVVDRIFILFPDPWPKNRHHKRRLVSEATLELLARILKKNGRLRLATDHAGYATWMLQHMLACEVLEWTAERCADWQLPPADWSPTRYEEKSRAQGNSSVYLDFVRR